MWAQGPFDIAGYIQGRFTNREGVDDRLEIRRARLAIVGEPASNISFLADVRIGFMLLETEYFGPDRPGEVVLREEIRQALWPNNTVVEFDHSINAASQRLRDALGDTAANPRYIETVTRGGYRFLAKVEIEDAGALQPPQASTPEPAADPGDSDGFTGRSLAHYRILDKLGEGGMGTVYRAKDSKLGRDVAVTFLSPDFVNDPRWLARFEREAKDVGISQSPDYCGHSRR